MEYEERISSVMVNGKHEPIFSEMATTIKIDDEAGGEFVQVCQNGQIIRIDVDEWPTLCAAIGRMVKECRVAG